jgi:hypothetical protein
MAGGPGTNEVVYDLLSRARRICGAETASFVHLGPDLAVTSYTVSALGPLQVTTEPAERWQALMTVAAHGRDTPTSTTPPRNAPDTLPTAGIAAGPSTVVAGASVGGRPVGYLAMTGSGDEPARFDGDERFLLQVLARSIGTTLFGRTPPVSDVVDHLEAEINLAVRRDAATGMPNDIAVCELLGDVLPYAIDGSVSVVALCVRADGRPTSSIDDDAMQVVAQRLRRCLRAHDSTSRTGTDQLAVIALTPGGERDAIAIGRRALQVLAGPVVVDGAARHLHVGVGISLRAGDTDPAAMISRATLASRSAGISDDQRIVLAVR